MRELDLGLVNGRAYLGVANVGFDGLANEYGNSARMNLGPFTYLYGGLKALVLWRNVRFTLTVDGRSSTFPGWFIAVGNVGQYGGGLRICPEAKADDGLLDVVSLGRATALGVAATFLRSYRGSHLGQANIDFARGSNRDDQRQQAAEHLRRRRDGRPASGNDPDRAPGGQACWPPRTRPRSAEPARSVSHPIPPCPRAGTTPATREDRPAAGLEKLPLPGGRLRHRASAGSSQTGLPTYPCLPETRHSGKPAMLPQTKDSRGRTNPGPVAARSRRQAMTLAPGRGSTIPQEWQATTRCVMT